MLFSKIEGHAQALSRISQEIKNKSFDGVFLFSGPVAIGKFTIARLIGKYLTCSGLQDDNCRCENCRLFPDSPDYIEISKNDKMIVVGDVEPISSFFTLKAFRGESRVVVIDNAHQMNSASSNRLLKIMEELLPNCVLIFVTDSPDRLLSPILSRCYKIDFSPLSPEEILEILRSLGHKTNQLGDIGRMLPYLSESILVNYPQYEKYIEYIPGFMKDVMSMGEDDLISLIKDIDNNGDISIFLDVFLIFINDLFKIRYDSPDVVSNIRKIDKLEELTEIWKDEICILMMDKIRRTQEGIKKRINLKPGQLFLPCALWLYYFLQKNKKAA